MILGYVVIEQDATGEVFCDIKHMYTSREVAQERRDYLQLRCGANNASTYILAEVSADACLS